MTFPARLAFLFVFLSAGWALRAQAPGAAAAAAPMAANVQPAVNSQPPFRNEIAEFKRRDSIQHPPPNAILFVGSSSFRKWTTVQNDFPGYTIINRGFGGSTLDDVIRYAGAIIYPYRPKEVVIYCGDNDLAAGKSAKKVFKRFVKLYDMIRKRLGNIDIVYVSIKPSPSRERLMPEMEKANDDIRNFIAQRSHASFVDVYHLMLNQQGRPIDSLFTSDKLHMNAKGYKIWQQALLPYLDK